MEQGHIFPIDIMTTMGWFVLKQIPGSSVENYEKELVDRLDYVKDLSRDEDGDWATGFIQADLNPNNVHISIQSEEPSSSRSGVVNTDKEGSNNSYVTCSYCKGEVSMEGIGQLDLKCRCNICKACIQSYVETCLQYDILHKKIIDSEGIESFKCSQCLCEDSVSLLEAQFLAPEAFRKWREAKDSAQTSGFFQCSKCDKVIRKQPADATPSMVPERDSNKMVSSTRFCPKMAAHFITILSIILWFILGLFYHQGKSFTESEEERHAAKCSFCKSPISRFGARSKSTKDLALLESLC